MRSMYMRKIGAVLPLVVPVLLLAIAGGGCGGDGTPPPMAVGLPVEGLAASVLWAAPRGDGLPLVLFLPGETNSRARDDFEGLAAVLVPRGYAVAALLTMGGTDGLLRVSFEDRIRGVAKLLKALRADKGVDLRRLAIVAAMDDRWVAAHVATRLRSAVRALVLVGAPAATLLEQRIPGGSSGRDRAALETRLRKATLGATTVRPVDGATASWWKDRLERALPMEMKGVSAPTLVLRSGSSPGEEERIAFLRRSLRIIGGPEVEEGRLEGLDGELLDGGGRRRFDTVARAAFPLLWTHCPPPPTQAGRKGSVPLQERKEN